jgi:hypothetical protein
MGIGDDFHPDRGTNARLVVESAVAHFSASGFRRAAESDLARQRTPRGVLARDGRR